MDTYFNSYILGNLAMAGDEGPDDVVAIAFSRLADVGGGDVDGGQGRCALGGLTGSEMGGLAGSWPLTGSWSLNGSWPLVPKSNDESSEESSEMIRLMRLPTFSNLRGFLFFTTLVLTLSLISSGLLSDSSSSVLPI